MAQNRAYALRVDSLGNHVPSSIDEISPQTALPAAFAISAWPNPFNSSVTIALDGVLDCHSRENGNPEGFTVEIFDVAGRRVAVAEPVEAIEVPVGFAVSSDVNAKLPSTGSGSVYIWQPAPTLPSGVYLVRARFVSDGPSTGSVTVEGSGTVAGSGTAGLSDRSDQTGRLSEIGRRALVLAVL